MSTTVHVNENGLPTGIVVDGMDLSSRAVSVQVDWQVGSIPVVTVAYRDSEVTVTKSTPPRPVVNFDNMPVETLGQP